jgi:hypothetical protein
LVKGYDAYIARGYKVEIRPYSESSWRYQMWHWDTLIIEGYAPTVEDAKENATKAWDHEIEVHYLDIKPCKYCNEETTSLISSTGIKVGVDAGSRGAILNMLYGENKYGFAIINNCPMCGRKLYETQAD